MDNITPNKADATETNNLCGESPAEMMRRRAEEDMAFINALDDPIFAEKAMGGEPTAMPIYNIF